MEWINIKDRMPYRRSLLLTSSKEIVIGDRYRGIWRIDGATRWESREFGNESGNGVLVSNFKDEDITHWMQLPDIPL